MKRLLIVVDFQKDFVDGALGFPGAEKLEDPIAKKIESYRSTGDEVVFTFDSHRRNYLDTLEGKNIPIEHCIEGSPGWNLYGKVADCITDTDCSFEKSSFGSMGLAEFLTRRQHAANDLRMQPFTSIELVGLVSHVCVLSNAVIAKAACPEVSIIVDAACTYSYDALLHEKSLDVMEGLHIKVINRS